MGELEKVEKYLLTTGMAKLVALLSPEELYREMGDAVVLHGQKELREVIEFLRGLLEKPIRNERVEFIVDFWKGETPRIEKGSYLDLLEKKLK